MSKQTRFRSHAALFLMGTVALAGCKESTNSGNDTANQPQVQNTGAVQALVTPYLSGLQITSVIDSDNDLPVASDATQTFIFGGSADGLGFFRNTDGTYTMLTNHEDTYAVSRVTLDKDLKPTKGEYFLTSKEGRYRLCSATLATPEEHGFAAKTFLTCGESGFDSQTHALSAEGSIRPADTRKAALGFWGAENAVPLPKTAFNNKTVILIGDDDSFGISSFGQLAIYVADGMGNLDGGKVYVATRTDLKTTEMDMVTGANYELEFKQVPYIPNTTTATEFRDACKSLDPVGFGRVEDIDYRKDGVGREVYFNVTGTSVSGDNLDYQRSKYGRVYKMDLPADFATAAVKKANLSVLLDGDSKINATTAAARTSMKADGTADATSFTNVDNICVTKDYIYIQEDSNGYGDEQHDAYIYQYNIGSKVMKVVMELNHFRTTTAPTVKSGSLAPPDARKGLWEYGAMVDVSAQTGLSDAFMICIQPHSWNGTRYNNPEGEDNPRTDSQASQVILVRGLAR
ncbi:MAG: hypothetical protein IAF08_13080 [Rhizobacter sp.]|nr:hypothetical protein [Chlorobiales bacterium]